MLISMSYNAHGKVKGLALWVTKQEEKYIITLTFGQAHPISCRNLSLGFATKARACKGACQKGSPRITSQECKKV
jgi:hypothetical protein